jgi:hypothetical protein
MPELQQFGTDIWIAEGPNVRDMGLTFTTRMTIVKLSDGSVWVESPVRLPSETLGKIKALGTVKYIVSSTQRHTWRLKEWHTLFPEAQLWAPGTTSLAIGQNRVAVDDVFTDIPYQGWSQDFCQLAFRGSPFLREVFFFHRKSGTVILGDLIQINPMIRGMPIRNLVFRMLGAAYPKGGVALDIRLSFTRRTLARESLERLLSWNFDKLIIAHGNCIVKDAKLFVKEAFRWLG